MLKLLILMPLMLLPLMLVGGALALGVALPLLALLPVLFAVGAGVLALVITFSILGLVLRVFAGLLLGAGGLVVVALGFGAFLAGGAVFLALGFALAHLLLPVLVVLACIWIIRRSARPAAPLALPAPQA